MAPKRDCRSCKKKHSGPIDLECQLASEMQLNALQPELIVDSDQEGDPSRSVPPVSPNVPVISPVIVHPVPTTVVTRSQRTVPSSPVSNASIAATIRSLTDPLNMVTPTSQVDVTKTVQDAVAAALSANSNRLSALETAQQNPLNADVLQQFADSVSSIRSQSQPPVSTPVVDPT